MKLLTNPSFDNLNFKLSMELVDSKIDGKLESYSCKLTSHNKVLWKRFNKSCIWNNINELKYPPPPRTQIRFLLQITYKSAPPKEGILCDMIDRKTLFYLIATLNASFYPDYDFSFSSSEDFSREPSLEFVMNQVDKLLGTTCGAAYVHKLREEMWSTMDKEISLKDCQIYSFNPPTDEDPASDDGAFWGFYYFFYNHTLKRIVFFTCKSVPRNAYHI
nr:EOG090X0C93 [Artemia franciscana]